MGIHQEFVELAREMIAENGRPMKLFKNSRTAADADKPWKGPIDSYEFEVEVVGVVTDYDEDEIDGDQVKQGDQKILIAYEPTAGTNLLEADSLLDEGQVFSVVKGNLLAPGIDKIMYTLQVRR